MKCPVCGGAELIHDTRDIPYTYKGHTTLIPSVTADFCPACDDFVMDMEELDRSSRFMDAFDKQVNASQVDPTLISRIRKNSRSTNAKPRNFSAAAPTPSPATKPARPCRPSRWSSC